MSKYFVSNKNYLGQPLISIICPEDNLIIPCDPANTDYQAYLAWVAEGNTAEEWSPENAS